MPRQEQRKRLARKDMEALIESGQSVIHEGVVITSADDLPTDVDLALGDPAKEAATEAEIDRQIKALEAAKSQLKAGKTEPPKPAPSEPAKPAEDPKPADDKTPEDKRAAILGGQTKPAK